MPKTKADLTPLDIARQAGMSTKYVKDIAQLLNIQPQRTPGNHRRFTKKQARRIVRHIRTNRRVRAESVLRELEATQS